MPKETRIWKVQNDRLDEVERQKLDAEKRIEDWLENDISILSDDLLVIGRQVSTEFSGPIDLLCLDRRGDLVVIELKRDQTPRDVVGQALEYAAWVRDLSNDWITERAEKQHDGEPLEQLFEEQFEATLPDVLNESHRLLIVASEIDSRTERIIEYLSDEHGVNINAVTFQFHKDDAVGELLARVFLIEPEQVEERTRRKGTSKRDRHRTPEELQQIAEENGVGEWHDRLYNALSRHLRVGSRRSAIPFVGDFRDKEEVEGKWLVVVSLIPTESEEERGLQFKWYLKRFMVYFGASQQEVMELMPEDRDDDWSYSGSDREKWSGSKGYFRNDAEVERFIEGVKEFTDGKKVPTP